MLDRTCLAEDVVQDTFIKLCRSSKTFQSEEHLKFWLLKVAANRCRDLNRLSRRHPEVSLDEPNASNLEGTLNGQNASPQEESELFDVIARCLEKLPDRLREVLHLYYVEEYSAKEIADITGASPTLVNVRLHRARKKVKAALTDNAEEVNPHGIRLGRI